MNSDQATDSAENNYGASMHTIEPELTERLPRRVRTNHQATGTIGCGCIVALIVLGVILFRICSKDVYIEYKKHVNDKVAMGKIEEVKEETDSDDHWTSDLVTFTFVVDGRLYRGTESVKAHAQKGEAVEVSYLPTDPDSDPFPHVNGTPRPDVITRDSVFTVVVLGSVIGLYIILVISNFRRKQIYVWGKATVARIYDKNETENDESTIKRLSYSFYPDEDYTRATSIKRTETVSKEFWESVIVGQTITVLYRPEKPSDCAIYPCQSFRVIA